MNAFGSFSWHVFFVICFTTETEETFLKKHLMLVVVERWIKEEEVYHQWSQHFSIPNLFKRHFSSSFIVGANMSCSHLSFSFGCKHLFERKKNLCSYSLFLQFLYSSAAIILWCWSIICMFHFRDSVLWQCITVQMLNEHENVFTELW